MRCLLLVVYISILCDTCFICCIPLPAALNSLNQGQLIASTIHTTTTIPIPSDKNAIQVHYGLLSDLMHYSTKVSRSNRFCEKTVIKVIHHLSDKTPDFSLITSEKTIPMQ